MVQGLYIHYSNQHKHFGDGKLPQEAPSRWTNKVLTIALMSSQSMLHNDKYSQYGPQMYDVSVKVSPI